jgi:uncharacterized alkaline shock family protein YloU
MTESLDKGSSSRPSIGEAGQAPGEASPSDKSPLLTERGRTRIADTVVAKVAGIATREISGVHSLGGGAARAVAAIRERIPGATTNQSQGVDVEVGETQAAVDIDIVADYGVRLADLAAAIRQNVIRTIETMTALDVTEVNVSINDVYVEEPDSDQGDASRVQ